MDDRMTQAKCVDIVRAILERCNKRLDEGKDKDWVIAFGPDWGAFSLTIYDQERGHTHVGPIEESGTFEELVTQMHDMLTKGRGLSWA